MQPEPGPQFHIGLIEDDEIMGESIRQRLTLEGYGVSWWRTGAEAVREVDRTALHLLISDIRLPDMDGESMLARLLPYLPQVPVIAITGFGRVEQAVQLMKIGVNDYLTKPFEMDSLLQRIADMLASHAKLSPEAVQRDSDEILAHTTRSAGMVKVMQLIEQVKDLDSTLLITGESGVGKELVSYYAHAHSQRSDAPYVAVNCATIPSELFESELFGYEKGAFTGAERQTEGYLEAAGEGTLLLDEVGDLPRPVQVKLLRVLQEQRFFRVGSRQETPFRARLICCTHRNLEEMVAAGTFRQDLFYRINVIPVQIPPLRSRRDDILPVARYYLGQFAATMNRPDQELAPDAEQALLAYDFPGNIRELRNRIERAVALSRGRIVNVADLFPERQRAADEGQEENKEPPLQDLMSSVEHDFILQALIRNQWQIALTAEVLGISRKTLWEKMKLHRISRPS